MTAGEDCCLQRPMRLAMQHENRGFTSVNSTPKMFRWAITGNPRTMNLASGSASRPATHNLSNKIGGDTRLMNMQRNAKHCAAPAEEQRMNCPFKTLSAVLWLPAWWENDFRAIAHTLLSLWWRYWTLGKKSLVTSRKVQSEGEHTCATHYGSWRGWCALSAHLILSAGLNLHIL